MTPPILMYHEIAPDIRSAKRLAVPADAFAAHLSYLHSEGFETLTASAVASALAEGTELPRRAVVITYDDGFADLHETALPLLSRYHFTATVYITTGWIQDSMSPCAWRRPGQMLNWRQISDLAEAGIEIGAHSCSHPQLDQLPDKQIKDELRIGKETLEAQLQRPVAGLAYPFGYSNARVRRMAQEVGYQYACVVGNRLVGPSWDPFALPRLTVKRSTGLDQFQRIVHGQDVPMVFFVDHVLTKAWATFRRAQSMWNRLRSL